MPAGSNPPPGQPKDRTKAGAALSVPQHRVLIKSTVRIRVNSGLMAEFTRRNWRPVRLISGLTSAGQFRSGAPTGWATRLIFEQPFLIRLHGPSCKLHDALGVQPF